MPPPALPAAAATLRRALILAADVPAAARFYSEGLGLGVASLTERWADLRGPGGRPALAIKAADSLSQTTAGYTPFLCFTVPDLQAALARCLALGGSLDGPVHYPPPRQQQGGGGGGAEGLGGGIGGVGGGGPVAAVRAPDGHMLALEEAEEGGG